MAPGAEKKGGDLMDAKTYKDFLSAVDTVCINCHYLGEETCAGCPVRKTCDNEIGKEHKEA